MMTIMVVMVMMVVMWGGSSIDSLCLLHIILSRQNVTDSTSVDLTKINFVAESFSRLPVVFCRNRRNCQNRQKRQTFVVANFPSAVYLTI